MNDDSFHAALNKFAEHGSSGTVCYAVATSAKAEKAVVGEEGINIVRHIEHNFVDNHESIHDTDNAMFTLTSNTLNMQQKYRRIFCQRNSSVYTWENILQYNFKL